MLFSFSKLKPQTCIKIFSFPLSEREKKNSSKVKKMADTQDLAKKLTFVDATHDLTRDVTEYENYFFGGGASSGEDSKDALIKKAKKDPNAQSLRRYKQTSLKFF